MKKVLVIFTVFFITCSQLVAQSNLNDYSFVIVPERFDFLAESNQYKLNDMTKFLFDKYGFNAFYLKDLPNVDLCDGLKAVVLEESNITRTSLTVVLEDCRGTILHTGQMGRSKYKEYKKAYQDALRKAFESVEDLRVNQRDIIAKDIEIDAEATISAQTTNKESFSKTPTIPSKKFSQYSYRGLDYLLKKNDDGFSLFQESDLAEDGLLSIAEILKRDSEYYCLMFEKEYPAVFEPNKDLKIIKNDGPMVLKFQN